MIAEKFRRLHPPEPSPCGQREVVPVVVMQMPTEPSVRRFYGSILTALNAPVSFNLSGERLERYALDLLRAVEVRMLIVDELHNLLAGTHRRRAEFLNMLRFLGNTLRIPIVGLGTKQAQIAVRSDDQLENRFEPIPLPVWQDDGVFARLLASCERALRLRERSALAEAPELRSTVLRRSGRPDRRGLGLAHGRHNPRAPAGPRAHRSRDARRMRLSRAGRTARPFRSVLSPCSMKPS